MSIKVSLIKNTLFNLGGYFYLLLASFFSISILLNNLGRDMFGAYLLLGSIVPLASVFDFGISVAVVRKLSLPDVGKKEKAAVWQTSFLIYSVLATILLFSVYIILNKFAIATPAIAIIPYMDYKLAAIIIAITVFINHVNNHFLNLPQAEQRFDIFNSKTFIVGSANTIVSAIISYQHPSLSVIFGIQLLFHLLTLVFLVTYSLRIFSINEFFPKFHNKTFFELIKFGFKNFIGILSGQAEVQFSKYMLGNFVSGMAVTAFAIPQNIVLKGAGIVSQVAQAFFPLSTSLLHKDRILKLKQLIIGLEILTLLVGIFAISSAYIFGRPFLLWWLKDLVVVDAAMPVLKILSFYFALTSLTPIPTALLQSLNLPLLTSNFALLTFCIEAIFMIMLVPTQREVGAAIATLIASVVTVPTFLIVAWLIFSKEIKKTQSPV